jgi:hypothetical protein
MERSERRRRRMGRRRRREKMKLDYCRPEEGPAAPAHEARQGCKTVTTTASPTETVAARAARNETTPIAA